MAKISIQHESVSENQQHLENIEKFKGLAVDSFSELDGEIIFDYITKYYQFDLVYYSEEIPEEEIKKGVKKIEDSYPNCFISNLNIRPSIKMDRPKIH